jgi:hypothetical protein
MTDLHSRHEINKDETKNQDTKKVEVLFDLKGDCYAISDTELCRNITCISGSCDLHMEKAGEKDTIALNSPIVVIRLEKGTNAEQKNYTPDTKVVVEYLGEDK